MVGSDGGRYTLWNAEYRISLMRNFDISPDSLKRSNCSERCEVLELQSEETKCGGGEVDVNGSIEDWEPSSAWSLGDLPPEALNYIQKLESELSTAKKVRDFFLRLWNFCCFVLVTILHLEIYIAAEFEDDK